MELTAVSTQPRAQVMIAMATLLSPKGNHLWHASLEWVYLFKAASLISSVMHNVLLLLAQLKDCSFFLSFLLYNMVFTLVVCLGFCCLFVFFTPCGDTSNLILILIHFYESLYRHTRQSDWVCSACCSSVVLGSDLNGCPLVCRPTESCSLHTQGNIVDKDTETCSLAIRQHICSLCNSITSAKTTASYGLHCFVSGLRLTLCASPCVEPT